HHRQERLVAHPNTMAGADRLHGVRVQDPWSVAQQRLVEAAQLAHRAATAAAGHAAGARLFRVDERPRHGLGAICAVHHADTLAVGAVPLWWHPHPTVRHAEWLEDLLAQVAVEGAAVQPPHDLAEHEPAGGGVIAGTVTGHP